MNNDDKNIGLNQIINANNVLDENNLFSNNDNQVFADTPDDMDNGIFKDYSYSTNNDISDEASKNIFWKLLTNRKVVIWISILVFVFTSITVGKTFYLRSIVDDYEDFYMEVESKL